MLLLGIDLWTCDEQYPIGWSGYAPSHMVVNSLTCLRDYQLSC